MKKSRERSGQAWAYANDLTLLVLGLDRFKDPILHRVLATDKAGHMHIAQRGEYHLRKWENENCLTRIDE